jgi:glycosyltransferase involved in cell wall biosynthesis
MTEVKKTINDRVWVVVPVYNNGTTIVDVVSRCRQVIEHVLVIDDGSDDIDLEAVYADSDITVIRHPRNLGKGAAILSAIDFLKTRDVDYMITIDGDGQHYPEDLPLFFPLLAENDSSMIIGCRDFNTDNIQASSRKGRAIANFWMKVETGLTVDDCQSGFRAYPVKYFAKLKFICRRYNFETEALVRAAWAGLELKCITVRTWYPEPDKRISHFHPWRDNWRISLIHTHLTGLRLLPIPHRKLVKQNNEKILELLHPLKFFKYLLKENVTPHGLAAAAAVGTFIAVIPMPGLHSVVIIYVATKLHLNKLMTFNIQHFFMPPFTPILCVEIGYWLMHGKWLLVADWNTLVVQLPERLLEWLIGSIVVAPVFAVITGAIVFVITQFLQRRKPKSILTTKNIKSTK